MPQATKMAKDDASDLSSLSSLSPPPPSESEPEEPEPMERKGILKFFSKAPKGDMAKASKEASPPRKREPSPPHEYVFADNPDIAVRRPCSFRALSSSDASCRVHDVIRTVLTHLEFIVMFRSRFDEAFPRSSPSFGPQELEYDITEPTPGSRAEGFLCAVLGLLLNRKQDVKYATTPPTPGPNPESTH